MSGVLDAFYVAPAEALHLAAEFEIPADLRVVQDAEASSGWFYWTHVIG